MDKYNFRVVLEQDSEGRFVASVPDVPGCFSEGETYEEAVKNVKEALGLCLEEARENKDYADRIIFPEKENRFLGVTNLSFPVNTICG